MNKTPTKGPADSYMVKYARPFPVRLAIGLWRSGSDFMKAWNEMWDEPEFTLMFFFLGCGMVGGLIGLGVAGVFGLTVVAPLVGFFIGTSVVTLNIILNALRLIPASIIGTWKLAKEIVMEIKERIPEE